MAAPLDPDGSGDLLERARRGDQAAVESVLAAMVSSSKARRAQPSPWLWRVAVIAAALGVVGFVLLVTSSSSGSSPGVASPGPSSSGHDLPIGIMMGLVAGLAIGWAVGRSRRQ